jgi:hypothetical protein
MTEMGKLFHIFAAIMVPAPNCREEDNREPGVIPGQYPLL